MTLAAPPATSTAASAAASLDTGDTAWLLAATALVLLMTPGLALFYGGMVRTKSVLNMLMMSFVSIALVTVVWLAVGYSLVFGDDHADAGVGGLIGGLEHAGMAGLGPDSVHGTVPTLLFATFQLTFAIITAALISGAVADRAKFGAWLVFVPLWALLVYVPVAHWVWGPGGWILADLGALDFAGGLPVEITSGASGLALCLVLGPRLGFKKDAMRPHNLPMVMLGAGLLWFGWFGFNAGSALGANGLAAAAFLNTLAASTARVCSAGSSWSSGATAIPPPWARRPARSRAWSPSPRPAVRSRCSARWSSASPQVSSARTPWPGSSASTTTTRWTSSACTWSAV